VQVDVLHFARCQQQLSFRQLSSLLALIVVLTNASRNNSAVLPLSIQIVCRIVIENVDTEDVGVNVNILENFM
jgi:hypothetical protein